ncbi:MAG: hypothetical protein D6737_17625 [Chloroflexi bacterium]|nr:MAG: hypothetical protein CUN54_06070 [Phototrophicales bacterium]RMF77464.1 MAG: hypothetical protein D6737_17625 [Chloroflexota bacterium]
MEQKLPFTKRNLLMTSFAFLLIVVGLLLTVSFSPSSTYAQEPTPTPNTPIWLAFSAVRDAIEEDRSVNLTLVQSYEWVQTEWVTGIDSCRTLDDPNAARQTYFGWTFRITSLQGQTYEGRVSFDLQDIAVCDEVSTNANAAAAGTTENADLPAPVAGAAAGGSFELGGHALEMSLNTFNLMRRAGMTWVKQQVEYNLGDDPSKVQGLIDVAHGTGFNILLSIRGRKEEMGDFNNYVNTFSQFLGGVAALGADAIEVWNEPNIDREWPVGTINGGNYTQMLAPAFNAIKAANPNTIVISGAPAPTGFFGAAGCTPNGCNDDVFMQQMAAAGAGQFMDCVGLHYNEGIVPPNQVGGDPRGEFPTYYFPSMLSRGLGPFPGKQACFTELGYLTPEGYNQPLPGAFAWAANTSVQQQAAWLADVVTAASQGGQVRMIMIWNVDFPFFTATDPMGGYAIFRPDESCPACDSLGRVMGVQ